MNTQMPAVAITAIVTTALVVLLAVPRSALADACGDLQNVQVAFRSAKSYHVEEHFSNGKTVVVEYSAPDRWRIQNSPTTTNLVIGNNVYAVSNGQTSKIPFGGFIMRKMIEHGEFSVDKDIQRSAQDLGTQTLNGETVHVYSYASHGNSATMYVSPDMLPVQVVVKDKEGKEVTTNVYSKYNQPISIDAPP